MLPPYMTPLNRENILNAVLRDMSDARMSLFQMCEHISKLFDETNAARLIEEDKSFWLDVLSTTGMLFLPHGTGLENDMLHEKYVLHPFSDVITRPVLQCKARVQEETDKARFLFVTKFKTLVQVVVSTAKDPSHEERIEFSKSFSIWISWYKISHMSKNDQDRYAAQLAALYIPNLVERQKKGEPNLDYFLAVYISHAEALDNSSFPPGKIEEYHQAAKHFSQKPKTMPSRVLLLNRNMEPGSAVSDRGTLAYTPIENFEELFKKTQHPWVGDELEATVVMWQTSKGQGAIKTIFGSLLPRNQGGEADDARNILLDWHCDIPWMLGTESKPNSLEAGQEGVPVCALMFLGSEKGCLSRINRIGLILSRKFWNVVALLKEMGRDARFEDLNPDILQDFLKIAYEFAREYVRATNSEPYILDKIKQMMPDVFMLSRSGCEYHRMMFFRVKAMYYGLTGQTYDMSELQQD